MNSKKQIYSLSDFVKEVTRRLSYLYEVDATCKVGKNKVSFVVEGNEVLIEKNRDKDTNQKKVIITYTEMFPYAFYTDDEDFNTYSEKEVIGVVNGIDMFYTEKLGLDPVKQCICSRYEALKWALLPCFITDFTNKNQVKMAQEEILGLLSYEALHQKDTNCENLLFYFTAQDVDTDLENKVFLFSAGIDKLTLYLLDYTDGVLEDNVEKIKSIEFEYGKYPGKSMLTAAKKHLKNHYNFRMCSVKFNEPEKPEDEVAND